MTALEINAIVSACYVASIDPAKWPDALEAIGIYYRASGAGIVFYDPLRNPYTVHSVSLKDANQPYRDYWWQHDTRITLAKRANFCSGNVVCDGHLISQEEKRRDPFFQEFGRAYGFDELMAYFARDPLGGIMTISVPRNSKGGAFYIEELKTWKILGAQVSQAFTLSATLCEMNSQIFSLQACLDQCRIGVIALDCNNEVIDVSGLATVLVKDCIRIGRDRKIAAINNAERTKLDSLIYGVGVAENTKGHRSALIRSIDGNISLFVQVINVRPNERDVAPVGKTYAYRVLLIRDFSIRAQPVITHHLERLSLTPAEARVAMMVGRGKSPNEVAEELSVSSGTVRAQLKAVFSKLGVRKQSELSSLICRFDMMEESGTRYI